MAEENKTALDKLYVAINQKHSLDCCKSLFAKTPYKNRALLQKKPSNLKSLRIAVTL